MQLDKADTPIWANPDDPSNQVSRPAVKCWGCGQRGCIDKHWGNWCFACNVKRMTRLSASFDSIAAGLNQTQSG